MQPIARLSFPRGDFSAGIEPAWHRFKLGKDSGPRSSSIFLVADSKVANSKSIASFDAPLIDKNAGFSALEVSRAIVNFGRN